MNENFMQLAKYQERFDCQYTEQMSAIFMSLPHYCITLGIFICGFVIDKYGRKAAIVSCAALMCASFFSLLLCTNLAIVMLGRVLSGLGDGFAFAATQVYLNEISLVRARGTISALNTGMINVSWNLAILLFGYVGQSLSLLIFTLTSLICIIILQLFVEETPHFLMKTNREHEARETMRRIRSENYDTEIELDEIKECLKKEAKSKSWKKLFTGRVMKIVGCTTTVMCVQALSGVDIIAYYVYDYTDLLLNESVNGTNATTSAGNAVSDTAVVISFIFQIGFVIGYAFSLYCMAKVKRRHLFMTCATLQGVLAFLIGIGFALSEYANWHKDPNYHWGPITALLFIWSVIYGTGMGPIGFNLTSELAPSDLKGSCTSFPIAMRFCLIGVENFFYPKLVALVGLSPPFVFFTAVCIFGAVFYGLVIPETKGATPQQLEKLFPEQPKKENSVQE